MTDPITISQDVNGLTFKKSSEDGIKLKPETKVRFVSKAVSGSAVHVYVNGFALFNWSQGDDESAKTSKWIPSEEVSKRVRIFSPSQIYHPAGLGYKVIGKNGTTYDVNYNNKIPAIGSGEIGKYETSFHITDANGKVFTVSGEDKFKGKIKLAVSKEGTFDISSIQVKDQDGIVAVNFHWYYQKPGGPLTNDLPTNFKGHSGIGLRKFTPDQLSKGSFKLEKVGQGNYRLEMTVTDKFNTGGGLYATIDKNGFLALN